MSYSPGERCEKLKLLLKPSEEYPWGRSSNSVATEIGVHLNVFISFLKSDGSPNKWDSEKQQYSSQHLNKLIEWIDSQDDPVLIQEDESNLQKVDSKTNLNPPPRNATHLDDFLESIDVKFVAYADKIISLGVKRPGDISNISLDELAKVGVKKLHARRIKSNPTVFEDAALIEQDNINRNQESLTPSEHYESFITSFIDKNNRHEQNKNLTLQKEKEEKQEEFKTDEDEESVKHELEKLLEQAEKLGLSGEELDKAKHALKNKIDQESSMAAQENEQQGNEQDNIPKSLIDFLNSIGDSKFLSYGNNLLSLGITRPGHLMDIELAQLKLSGIKTLHARRMKTNPTVFMDAADIAIENENNQYQNENDGNSYPFESENDSVDGWTNVGTSFDENTTLSDIGDNHEEDEAEEEEDDDDEYGDNDRHVAYQEEQEKQLMNNQLADLLKQAQEMGLSGSDIEAAKAALN